MTDKPADHHVLVGRDEHGRDLWVRGSPEACSVLQQQLLDPDGYTRLLHTLAMIREATGTERYMQDELPEALGRMAHVHIPNDVVADMLREYADALRSGELDGAGRSLPEDVEEVADQIDVCAPDTGGTK